MYSVFTLYHSTLEQLRILLDHHRAPNPDLMPSSSSHSTPQRRRRSGRAPVPAGGIQKRSGRQSRIVTVLSRAREPLYELRTRVHRLDDEHWTAPESETSTFFRQPVSNVNDPLQWWYHEHCDERFDDLAALAINLFSIPGTVYPSFLRPFLC